MSFYCQAFGWDTRVMSDVPEFRYTTFGDAEPLAGIMDATANLAEGAPATWQIHFGVEDTDNALAQIVGLGRAIVLPADDSPFGRPAHAADPTGAVFKLISSTPR